MKSISHRVLPILFLFTLLFFSCNSTKKTTKGSNDVIKDRIMALLKPNIQGKALEKEFMNYKFQNQGQTSRSENRWIYTFDTSLIQPDEMLKKVKASDKVLEAQFAPLVKE